MGAGHFVVIEPNPRTAQIVANLCRTFRPTSIATTFAEARHVLGRDTRFIGIIAEIQLPGGGPMELIKQVRLRRPRLPILVLTGSVNAELVNTVYGMRAELLAKPTRRRALRRFLRRAVAFERLRDAQLAEMVDEYARRHLLTARETDILVAAIARQSRDALASELGTTLNTLKTQIRLLLRKCKMSSLEEMATDALREFIACEPGTDSQPVPSESSPSIAPPTIPPLSSPIIVPPNSDAEKSGRGNP